MKEMLIYLCLIVHSNAAASLLLIILLTGPGLVYAGTFESVTPQKNIK